MAEENKKLFLEMDLNISKLKEIFQGAGDVVFREFYGGNNRLFMVYIDNMVNEQAIENSILTNLMARGKTEGNTLFLQLKTISVGEVSEIVTFGEVCDAILLGDTVIFSENYNKAAQISTKGWPSRGVPEVKNEVTIQGSKEAFVEQASKNTVLVRRRIRDTRLKVMRTKSGVRSKTDIAILYIEDIVRKEILEEVISQIENINIDAVLDSGYVGQFLEERKFSLFPQIQTTERPDKTAAAIYEGRIAVLVDNSPFALLVPSTFNVFFQAADDYYERWQVMSFLRILRFGAALMAATLPALYIALTVFHPNLIPTSLALKIAVGRANVPFPTILEMLLMELAFELLQEAGVRLPSPIGGAIGIVGGIVIGQAAVDAGIVGPAVVIIAALTGICSFSVPNVTLVSGIKLVKYLLIFLSALFGLFGFWIGAIITLVHLSSLESFGIPYMFPFCGGSVNNYSDFKDSIIRVPIMFMKKRPIFSAKGQVIRMGEGKNDEE